MTAPILTTELSVKRQKAGQAGRGPDILVSRKDPELQARIDRVVAKAQAKATGPNEDVIQIDHPVVIVGSLRVHKIG